MMTRRSVRTTAMIGLVAGLLLAALLVTAGCAKYNTFFNAKRMFDKAEQVREDAIKDNQDPPVPTGGQKGDYESAIRKAQKLIDEYPGHNLTDDALFLQAKSYHRLQSYRMSIRKFDLLFTNFPATPFMEEALYLQSLNYLLLGSVIRSREYLEQLARQFPESEFQSLTRKVSGDNAYALEEWEEAAGHYRDFLSQFPDTDEWDRVGLKLGECYWELEDYRAAADILQEVAEKTTSTELGFQADLLRAKSLVRTGNFDLASTLLTDLEQPAPIYQSEGEVLLAQVEMRVAQGRAEDAFPLLDAMPDEWKTPQVKARSAEMLAGMYLQRDELEDAQTYFRDALAGKTFLEDEFETRQLSDNLNDYLAAENALPDASAERIPRLKLLQANALLFGFDRPGEAARLYREAAVDSAADSTVAARALYGAVKVYREYLSRPDSADYFGSLLQERYPDSPQAFEMQEGGGSLLTFLLDRRTQEQQLRLAELSDQELADLMQVKEFTGSTTTLAGSNRIPVRRRLVYLSRRSNILYPPPELALAAARQAQLDAAAAAAGERIDPATGESGPVAGDAIGPDGREPTGGPVPGLIPPPGGTAAARRADGAIDPNAPPIDPEQTVGEEAVQGEESVEGEAEGEEEDEEKKKEDEKKEKDKTRGWEFDLRTPAPDLELHPAGEPRS